MTIEGKHARAEIFTPDIEDTALEWVRQQCDCNINTDDPLRGKLEEWLHQEAWIKLGHGDFFTTMEFLTDALNLPIDHPKIQSFQRRASAMMKERAGQWQRKQKRLSGRDTPAWGWEKISVPARPPQEQPLPFLPPASDEPLPF